MGRKSSPNAQTALTDEPQLLQLRFKGEPWKMLVACILLNRTQRVQVDRVIDELFRRWPTPDSMMCSGQELNSLLTSLGMKDRRAAALRRFSRDWLAQLPPADCFGVGSYALDSYRLFVEGDLGVIPKDKQLRRWIHWKLEGPS
jgi:methyl-CpG-binding domain protein 4